MFLVCLEDIKQKQTKFTHRVLLECCRTVLYTVQRRAVQRTGISYRCSELTSSQTEQTRVVSENTAGWLWFRACMPCILVLGVGTLFFFGGGCTDRVRLCFRVQPFLGSFLRVLMCFSFFPRAKRCGLTSHPQPHRREGFISPEAPPTGTYIRTYISFSKTVTQSIFYSRFIEFGSSSAIGSRKKEKWSGNNTTTGAWVGMDVNRPKIILEKTRTTCM